MFQPLQTERLLLRPARSADAAALAARRSDTEANQYQSWEGEYSLEAAQGLLAGLAPEPVPDQWWMITIADLADTTIYGDMALQLQWDGRSVELGCTLAREHWGHGYAVEAVEALLTWLWADPARTRVCAQLHPDNHASAQVLDRTGFRFEGQTRLSYWVGDTNSDDWIYGMTRADWDDWHARPRQPPEAVSLVEIGPDNDRAVRALRSHRSQERFVAPVLNSFADALVPEVVDGAPLQPWLRAVNADGELAGFVMVALTTDAHPEPYLWRLLIDRRHQRRGIGRMVLGLVAAQCLSNGDTTLLTSWVDGRGSPRPFYENYGFEPTGRILDGEIEARLVLPAQTLARL